MAVRIIVQGVGDIAPITVWQQCYLETAVSGISSPAVIIVRDIGSVRMHFNVGARVTVDLGPGTDPIWSGYLMRASRRFWFSVDKPDTLQRQWALNCVDINILFSRRVVYKKSNPASVEGPIYKVNTDAADAFQTLVDDWLDLSFDDLDTTTRISNVGNIYAGQPVYPWNGGERWGDAMKTIAQLPAAVWGIDPLRRVVLADVDAENAPFVLSDRPGEGIVGYRESTIWFDGSALGNDVLGWGMGMGSALPVFDRQQDDDSINLHGLWQDGFTSFAIWKQSTIERAVGSHLNGSAQSKRGHKDDRVMVECVIHEDGLRAGDRVRYRSVIWGFEDVIPVRKMRILFPVPGVRRYELTLTHEIDVWGFEDPPPPFPGVPELPGPPGPAPGEGWQIIDNWDVRVTCDPDNFGNADNPRLEDRDWRQGDEG